MSGGQSEATTCESTDDWPAFTLTHTYNPTDVAVSLDLDPDELVVFEPSSDGDIGECWLTAERGSYVSIETVR